MMGVTDPVPGSCLLLLRSSIIDHPFWVEDVSFEEHSFQMEHVKIHNTSANDNGEG